MKMLAVILTVLAIYSTAPAGTMIIGGLPATVNTSAGPGHLIFDIVGNRWFNNQDSLYVCTYTGGTLDIATATNHVVPGEIFGDALSYNGLGDYVDTTNVTYPVIWADIAIPQIPQPVIVGDIISDLGLTIEQGYQGTLEVKVLTELTGWLIQDVATIQCIPEPATIAILALGALYLRRRKWQFI